MLPQALLDVLVCPRSKRPLVYFPEDQLLFCPASRLRYRIEAGVPVMLVEEATELSEAEAAETISRARALGLALPT